MDGLSESLLRMSFNQQITEKGGWGAAEKGKEIIQKIQILDLNYRDLKEITITMTKLCTKKG